MTVRRIGTHGGEPVLEARLASDAGVELAVMSWGAAVRDWRVPDASGAMRIVTLGFETFEPYPEHSRSFGIVAGRLANRVREGRFSLGGRTIQLDRNKGPDHLHGGGRGLGRRIWNLEADERRARLTITSPDGEMGYPGNVDFTVEIALDGHTVTFDMTGVPDEPTPIALAQHSYYHLGGPLSEHRLMVAADRVTVTDERNVPTGALAEVAGTDLDFRAPRRLGDTRLDDNFCLTGASPAAVLESEAMRLELDTDRPGLQVFTADDFPEFPVPGLGGRRYGPRAGVALEAQDWPDSVNHDHFPDVVATPDRPYRQTTRVTIRARDETV